MAINRNSVRADIFKELRAVIKDNILTQGVKVTGSWTEESGKLPEVVISTPNVPRIKEAFGTESPAYLRDGSVDVEVFAKTKKSLIELYDDVEQAIFNNLDELSIKKVEIGESSDASFDLGGKIIHNTTLPLSFKLRI